jgi:hypothetical protein
MTKKHAFFLVGSVFAILVCADLVRCEAASIEFNRDIRPILSNNCFTCHGPDHGQRKADLRLDVPENAAAPYKEGTPIVAGKPEQSELVKRITSSDPDEKMPPPKSEKKLSAQQIEILKQWIAQGGQYQKHWAFIPPQRSAMPDVKMAAWCRNPIDRFILARLEAEGLKPSPQADKATLIRRVTFDLTGLPPTPAEVDAFLLDSSPDAYEKVVDRLLANLHYGERMANDWLDAARYADTHGYHIDSGRDQTAWREWVIDAFNQNKPFDQFTIEQLAGDLLPNATTEQKIATAFVRNNMVNFEGGAIPEEYLTAYVIDRVSTVSTVWLGLTLQCCQCHDHKFDPFTQKDFYSLYAYFNHVPENGLDGQKGNAAPFIRTPTKEQQERLNTLAAGMKQAVGKLAAPMPALDDAQAQWEQIASADKATEWTALDPSDLKSKAGAIFTRQDQHAILVGGTNPPTDVYTIVAPVALKEISAIRLEALPDKSLAGRGPGRSANGNFVLTDVRVSSSLADAPEDAKPVKLNSASADFEQETFPVASAIDDDAQSGWSIFPQAGKSHSAIFEFAQPIKSENGVTLTITLSFESKFAQHQIGRLRLSATDSSHPHTKDSIPPEIRKILAVAPDERTADQKASLKLFYRGSVSTAFAGVAKQLAELKKQYEEAEKSVRTTMVMVESEHPRDTFVLTRGQYDKHGEKVTPAVPTLLAPQPDGAAANRLGLAQWLVSRQHPLTARVTVNRLWQSFFGTGIVKTVEDFGSGGEEPTHPLLLDWLACEFMQPESQSAHPWDVKGMVRLIVTSATYRQSSAVTPELLARDPEDRLLARAPRYRLPAEFIRDQALAVSGLLNPEIGGRSVNPYQPPGLWEELMSREDGAKWTAQVYVQDHGNDLYRRTMYTFWKRTSPPPTLLTFDAPDRETCTVRRPRTNTPLQALVLMNDPTYVEASRKLAERMMSEAGEEPEARIAYAFKLATARLPNAREASVLKEIYQRQLAAYRQNPAGAEKLLKVGESPVNQKLDPQELAAWTIVASAILNLDETITKG